MVQIVSSSWSLLEGERVWLRNWLTSDNVEPIWDGLRSSRSPHLKTHGVYEWRHWKVIRTSGFEAKGVWCSDFHSPVPKSQSSSSPGTLAPRGEVSGKTKAISVMVQNLIRIYMGFFPSIVDTQNLNLEIGERDGSIWNPRLVNKNIQASNSSAYHALLLLLGNLLSEV